MDGAIYGDGFAAEGNARHAGDINLAGSHGDALVTGHSQRICLEGLGIRSAAAKGHIAACQFDVLNSVLTVLAEHGGIGQGKVVGIVSIAKSSLPGASINRIGSSNLHVICVDCTVFDGSSPGQGRHGIAGNIHLVGRNTATFGGGINTRSIRTGNQQHISSCTIDSRRSIRSFIRPNGLTSYRYITSSSRYIRASEGDILGQNRDGGRSYCAVYYSPAAAAALQGQRIIYMHYSAYSKAASRADASDIQRTRSNIAGSIYTVSTSHIYSTSRNRSRSRRTDSTRDIHRVGRNGAGSFHAIAAHGCSLRLQIPGRINAIPGHSNALSIRIGRQVSLLYIDCIGISPAPIFTCFDGDIACISFDGIFRIICHAYSD